MKIQDNKIDIQLRAIFILSAGLIFYGVYVTHFDAVAGVAWSILCALDVNVVRDIYISRQSDKEQRRQDSNSQITDNLHYWPAWLGLVVIVGYPFFILIRASS